MKKVMCTLMTTTLMATSVLAQSRESQLQKYLRETVETLTTPAGMTSCRAAVQEIANTGYNLVFVDRGDRLEILARINGQNRKIGPNNTHIVITYQSLNQLRPTQLWAAVAGASAITVAGGVAVRGAAHAGRGLSFLSAVGSRLSISPAVMSRMVANSEMARLFNAIGLSSLAGSSVAGSLLLNDLLNGLLTPLANATNPGFHYERMGIESCLLEKANSGSFQTAQNKVTFIQLVNQDDFYDVVGQLQAVAEDLAKN